MNERALAFSAIYKYKMYNTGYGENKTIKYKRQKYKMQKM